LDHSRSTLEEAERQAPARRAQLGPMASPLRFCVVGVGAFVVNMLVFWLLKAQLWLLPASALANEAAVLASFLLNDRWTFAAKGRHKSRWRRLLHFNGVALGGIVISVMLFGALVTYLSLDLLLANVVAVGAGSAWNYSVGSRWAWGRHHSEG
jgi:putative flippase GtrA